MEFDFFNWVILPLLILIARMSDVTLATLRNIFLSKSIKYIVPFLGFIEVLIWLLAISQIMKNLQNPACFIAYATGYSLGIFFGIKIEERLALGLQVLRVIIPTEASDSLIASLVEKNYGITILDGHGSKGPVKVVFTVVRRKNIREVQALINSMHPTAFYSIEDIRSASHGVFPASSANRLDQIKRIFPIVGGK